MWAFILALLITAPAIAQTVTFPTAGVYRPGVAMPVTIEAAGPGLIEIRGDGVQGIDWPAAGRGAVTVPLVIWQDTAGDLKLSVNGRSQSIALVPLSAGETVPPALVEQPDNAAAAALAVHLADDNSLADWTPGRPAVQRRWLLLAAIASTLAIGAILPWRKSSGVLIALGISAIACATIAVFSPAPPVRREVAVTRDRRYSEIDYAATRQVTFREPVENGLWLLPRSLNDVATLRPVLECDATGKPQEIRIELPANGRARFLRLNP